jgi:predicted nucleic acid-binding protein
MNLYLDTSALVKCYVAERGSEEAFDLTMSAEIVASSLISQTEVAAAIAKAVRLGWLTSEDGRIAQRAFLSKWTDFFRIPVTETLLSRADSLAWSYALRAHDAVQLASALTWQESLGAPVTLATFDRELWQAAPKASLRVWPAKLAR